MLHPVSPVAGTGAGAGSVTQRPSGSMWQPVFLQMFARKPQARLKRTWGAISARTGWGRSGRGWAAAEAHGVVKKAASRRTRKALREADMGDSLEIAPDATSMAAWADLR
jgi:hypothetical protein